MQPNSIISAVIETEVLQLVEPEAAYPDLLKKLSQNEIYGGLITVTSIACFTKLRK